MAPGGGAREGLGAGLMDLRAAAEGPPFDLVITGGGINGAGIAQAAALAGLRVALFEKDDFGFGTTWRSTKLIHGGLRYLEHGDVRLVFESLRERNWLLKTRPHLVHPQRMLFPMMPWTRRPAWQVRLGLIAYDAMAARGSLPRHRWFSRETMASAAPHLAGGHAGGFAFYDARARAPERLAIELAMEAREHGALVVNHAEVVTVTTRSGAVSGVEVDYRGARHSIPARAVVNAAGPWVDAVNHATGADAPKLLGVTRGSHIVLDCGYGGRDAIYSTTQADGRVFFAVPQDGLLLVGTTDIRYDGEPGAVHPTRAEVDYLLGEAQSLLPGLSLDPRQVQYAYAGLRPLQRSEGKPEAAIPRSEELVRHADSGGPEGLYSVIGGKLSTYRPLARELLRALGAKGKLAGRAKAPAEGWRACLSRLRVPGEARLRLRTYGPALMRMDLGEGEGAMGQAHLLPGELAYVVEREMASTLEDVLLRRTGAGWGRTRGLDCHTEVARALAPLLGWTGDDAAGQVASYEATVRRHLPTMEELEEGNDSPA